MESAFYTVKKISNARKNITQYAWAKEIRDKAVETAEKYLTQGLDWLWGIIPAQSIYRSYEVNQTKGSPLTGKKIDAFGNYPYYGDPINMPWKIQDPTNKKWYPANDFAAYYRTGLDDRGVFNPVTAKKRGSQYLKNTMYPELGEGWGVDDGYGFIDEKGDRYTFIAYYCHWYLWHTQGSETAAIREAINAFRDAYIYTGDGKYAVAGLIMLDRIADLYPDMTTVGLPKKGFNNSDGRSDRGKILGCIWEAQLTPFFLYAYDAFKPMAEHPDVAQFLCGKKEEFPGLPDKYNGSVVVNFEENFIKEVYKSIMNTQISGNFGMIQHALAAAAVVYDRLPETKEWLDTTLNSNIYEPRDRTARSGCDILATLVNEVDRDGFGNEAAPGYNSIWFIMMQDYAKLLEDYPLYDFDLFKHPKYKKMLTAMFTLQLSKKYTPNIGDSSATGNPSTVLATRDAVLAYEKYNAPRYAQMAYWVNDGVDGIRQDIYKQDPELIAGKINNEVIKHGPYHLVSDNITGYGFCALRKDNAGEHMRDLWLYYGRNTGHGHKDTLNMGIHAYGVDMAPDFGYPEYANEAKRRFEWESHTISHNTVLVDGKRQNDHVVGKPLHFEAGERVRLIDVCAPDVYPQTKTYRRVSVMVDIDERDSYYIDFFRVSGGNSHHYSFHGAEGAAVPEGINFVKQSEGTYEGRDVPYPTETLLVTDYNDIGGGFNWLKNVERAKNTEGAFSIDWAIKDTWGVYEGTEPLHLKLTMLGEYDEVALADGVPPQNKVGNPKSLRFLIAKREGAPADSLFVSVIEPYCGKSRINAIEQVKMAADGDIGSNDAFALKVVLDNGQVDFIMLSFDNNNEFVVGDKISFNGFFGLFTEKNGKATYSFISHGQKISDHCSTVGLSGKVMGFTKEMTDENVITVSFDTDENIESGVIHNLTNKYIYIDNNEKFNGSYRIHGCKKTDDKLYALSIGDVTLINSWADKYDFAKGYNYNIHEGDSFTIPFSSEWFKGC